MVALKYILLLLLIESSAIQGVKTPNTLLNNISDPKNTFDADLFAAYDNVQQVLQNITVPVIEEVLSDINTVCAGDIFAFVRSPKTPIEENLWALQMLDATAKIPSGILAGNSYAIGQFDECLSIRHPDDKFSGQHCMLGVAIPLPSQRNHNYFSLLTNKEIGQKSADNKIILNYGLCIPSTCSPTELNQIFGNLTNKLSIAVDIKAEDDLCWTDDKEIPLDYGDWIYIGAWGVLVALVVLSTGYDTFQRLHKKNDKPSRLYCAFSLYSNAKELCTISSSNGDMGCLHGMRTLSMAWVVLGHAYENAEFMPILDGIGISKAIQSDDHIIITNGVLSVDTFFFLSGLLVAFVFFRNIEKLGSFDAPMSYIHRYLRLTPQLLFVIFFHATVFENLNKGPLWNQSTSFIVDQCRTDWWTIILYVHNYVRPKTQCMGQGWYLPVDMQMFWIAPLLLYPIILWPKPGMVGLVFITTASSLWSFGVDLTKDYSPTVSLDQTGLQFQYEYVATQYRMTPWLVGMVLGVVICYIKSKKIKIKLSKIVVIGGWLIATGLCLASIFGYARFINGTEYTNLETSAFLAFNRLSWGLGLAWIVFACVHNYGGVANSFMSLGIFQPLGKLTYCVYIIHISVQAYHVAVIRTNINIADLEIVYFYLGDLVISYLLALILYVTVEVPVGVLDKELLSKFTIAPYPRKKEKE